MSTDLAGIINDGNPLGSLPPITYVCGHTAAEMASAGTSRWGLKEVSYFVAGYPVGLGMTKRDVDAAVEACFGDWQSKCGLSFKRAGGATSANIVMGVGRGQRAGFDGKYGTLAFCYLPQGDNFQGQLEMFWDLDEPWTVDPGNSNGINFATVTKHELGHGIGISHLNANQYPQQLMNPVYNPRISTPQQFDIAQAQDRYGKPIALPIPPTTPPTTPPGSSVAVIVQLPDGSIFKGRIPAAQALALPEGSFVDLLS